MAYQEEKQNGPCMHRRCPRGHGFGEWCARRVRRVAGPSAWVGADHHRRLLLECGAVPCGVAAAHAGVSQSAGRGDCHWVHGRVLPGSQYEFGEVDGDRARSQLLRSASNNAAAVSSGMALQTGRGVFCRQLARRWMTKSCIGLWWVFGRVPLRVRCAGTGLISGPRSAAHACS